MNAAIWVGTAHTNIPHIKRIENEIVTQFSLLEGWTVSIQEFDDTSENLSVDADANVLFYTEGEAPAINLDRTICLCFNTMKFVEDFHSGKYAGLATHKSLRTAGPYIFGMIEGVSEIEGVVLFQSEKMKEGHGYFKASVLNSMSSIELVVKYLVALAKHNQVRP